MATAHARLARGKRLFWEQLLQNPQAELAAAFLSYHWFSNCCLMTVMTAGITPCSRTVCVLFDLDVSFQTFLLKLGVIPAAWCLLVAVRVCLCLTSAVDLVRWSVKQQGSRFSQFCWRKGSDDRNWNIADFLVLILCSTSAIGSEFELNPHVNAHTITWLFVGRFTLISSFSSLVSSRVWSKDVLRWQLVCRGATKGLTAFTMCSRCIVQYHCGVFSHSYWFPVKLCTQWLHFRGSGGAEALTSYLTLFLSFYFHQFLTDLHFFYLLFTWCSSFSCDQTGI